MLSIGTMAQDHRFWATVRLTASMPVRSSVRECQISASSRISLISANEL